MDLLIRCTLSGKVVEAEIEGGCKVEILKKKIAESLNFDHEGSTLFYKGRKISDDADLERYSIEDNDLLVLEKRDKVDLDPGLEAVKDTRNWIRQNIVTSGTDVELRDYSLKEGGGKEMIFELESEMAKLSMSGGKIDDYGLVSSEKM